MRAAIVYNEDNVFVEFPPQVFASLLKTYLARYQGDVDQALEAIVVDLKKQTLYK